jgi:hypothetical protein
MVNQYKFFCNTEQQYVYKWGNIRPETCPNNSSHKVDLGSIEIKDMHSRSCCRKITISGNSTYNDDFSYPYPIFATEITFYPKTENKDDIVNSFVSPNTTIGALTQAAAVSDTVINVSSTVLEYIYNGFLVYLGSTYVGECNSYDTVENTVTLSQPLSQEFAQGSSVKITVSNIRNFVLCPDIVYKKQFKDTWIRPTTVIRIQYTNNTSESKEFYYSYEYLY